MICNRNFFITNMFGGETSKNEEGRVDFFYDKSKNITQWLKGS